jgi:2-keto-4-pentenoate hydratase/2-oxohepta-3-ene-1,7-dioic acid hydratase in catechol pathway
MDKIICVGKNYLKHAAELGDAVPEEPLFFLKPPSTICVIERESLPVPLPPAGEIHHEVELVLKLTSKDDKFEFTHYTFGVDLTIRDLQSKLKKAGQPWEKAKVFANSAILGPWQPISTINAILTLPFSLAVNDKVRQKGVGNDMRWKPEELVNDAARWFPLRDGDIMFTGTPEGVGPMVKGDRVEVRGGAIRYQFVCA